MANYFSKIKQLIEEKTGLDPEEVTEESCFEDDLNLGEMELIEILSELEEHYHVNLVEDIESFVTVQDVIDALEEHIQ